jgi:alpha-galactosidase
MKKINLKYITAFFILAGISLNSAAQKQQRQIPAQTPPMGWNSYNCFGSAVHEDEVKANALYMAQHLKQYGWQYIVVDFLWSYDNPPGSKIGNPFQKTLNDGSYIPWLTMDKWGRLLPQPTKFPSAFKANGFKPLADYVHSLGLKFGIHVMRGIPRQAVWAKSPVLGADGITADMIADTASKCPWMNQMYGLNMSKPGAQAYLNSILNLYASWGVDFIKVDDISRPYSKSEIEGYRKAIQQCHRPIVMSISPGETSLAEANHVSQYANMWRMADDFWDNWKEILHMFAYAKKWEGVSGPGHWPDCDMIQIGKLSKRGPVGAERYSRFTEDEEYTHFTFWSIFRSPLMLGGNLPENRPFELKLFSNDEVLAVNQHGENPMELYDKDGHLVWYSHQQNSKNIFVALFNTNKDAENIAINLDSLGFTSNVKVRDLWRKMDMGEFKGSYQQKVNSHGAVLLKISKP